MDKDKARNGVKIAISQLSRTELEEAHMNLFEVSLQKTQLIKDLEKKLTEYKSFISP